MERSLRVGVWGTFDVANYGDLLFPRIFELEIRRRLPWAEVRSFAPLGHLRPVPLDGGFLAESLTPWNEERARILAEELHLVAVGGGEIIHTHDEFYGPWYGGEEVTVRPSELFIEALGAEREKSCPVVWHSVGIPFDFDDAEASRVRAAVDPRPYVSVRDEVSLGRLREAGVTTQVDVVPDSAVLVDRLFPPAVLERRLRFLRATDAYPADERPLVIQGNASLVATVDVLAPAIAAAVENNGEPIPIVLLETAPCHDDGAFATALAARLGTRVHRVGEGATVEDIAAAIVNARAVAGISLHAAITAYAHGVPSAILNLLDYTKHAGFAALARYGDLHVTTVEGVEQALRRILAGARAETPPAELAARVDTHFDRLAELATASAAARDGGEVTANGTALAALRSLEERYKVLLRAHEGRGARLVEERLRFAALFERLEDGARRRADLAELEETRRERDALRQELAQLAAADGPVARRERDAESVELARELSAASTPSAVDWRRSSGRFRRRRCSATRGSRDGSTPDERGRRALIRFEHADRPLVSIVMPTHGNRNWVRRSLTALAEHTRDPFEVIVCDNASPNGTTEWLRDSVEGVRLVLNERNVGFAVACNQGAALSRAPHIVFLNSDAMVHPDWLPPLLERARDERVAAVAPLLLNLDGSVQDAGALVFRGAETILYGFGQEPHDPDVAFSRAVDYASGACLLVRRSAFNLVGGFDAAFGVAYYEDVDLCLALQEQHLLTVYEPRSVVTHALGGSGNPENAAALLAANRLVTEPRWRRRLACRPPVNAGNPNGVGARDALAAGRLLMLTGAAGAEAARRLAVAHPELRVTLVVGDDVPFAAAALRRDGVEVVALSHLEPWLTRRRFHYDVVVGGEEDEQLATTQPQALHLPAAASADALADALALAPLG